MQQKVMQTSIWTRSQRGFNKLALFIGALFLVLILSGCTVTNQGEADVTNSEDPQIFIEPEISQAGELISVTGSGWEPISTVYLNLNTVTSGRANAAVAAVAQTNSSGNFVVSFLLPTNRTPASKTTLTANAATSDLEASIALTFDQPATAASLASAPTSTATRAALPVQAVATGRGQVTGSFVNVRQGPTTAYPVLFVAKAGDPFSVLGRNVKGNWLRIRLDSGVNGWMATALTDYTIATLAEAPVITTKVFLPALSSAPKITNWRGEYFNNRTLSGAPALVRNDLNVKFNWGYSSPRAAIQTDDFSARWTRNLEFPAGAYRFTAKANGGIRVWIDNEMIIDSWSTPSAQPTSIERTFDTFAAHTLRVEYYEDKGLASVDFGWERVTKFAEWRGAYFSNSTLSGDAALVRNDPEINFDWKLGSPADGLPNDNFSARWTRNIEFAPGVYRFHTIMDDGLRLYIDGNLVIDQWRDGGEREIVADYPMVSGFHSLRVEYYERDGRAKSKLWWEKVEQVIPFTDWKGEYWANTSLTGDPIIVRNDSAVNFSWGTDAPIGLGVTDDFSARWTRAAQFDSGLYRFRVSADDGVRVWVDNQLILEDWSDGGAGELVVDRQMSSGTHPVRVEYYESRGTASINLRWERIPTDIDFTDWKGEYWSNRDLAGSPTLVRNDRNIDFNWTIEGVAAGMPRDRFSARWTRTLRFDSGDYRFYTRADDGIRFYVDGKLIINEWHDNNSNQLYVADVSLDGNHSLKVEYYEDQGGARAEFWWQRNINTPTPQPSPTSTATPTQTPLPTATSLPAATNTTEPTVEVVEPTNTPEPTVEVVEPTDTPEPTVEVVEPTNTPAPTVEVVEPTNTPVPTVEVVEPTNTPVPTVEVVEPTDTPEPTVEVVEPTDTPEPTVEVVEPTNTPEPTVEVVEPTDTPEPVVEGVTPDPVLTAIQNETTGMIDISGTGFPANVEANVFLQLADGTISEESYGTEITDADGLYTLSFSIPATMPDGAPMVSGPVTLVVVTQDESAQGTVIVEYVMP